MKKIELFEQPVACCSTDISEENFDPNSSIVNSIFMLLEQHKLADTYRHNLSINPNAFLEHEKVNTLFQEHGNEILPITIVDGKVVKTGKYPTLEEYGDYFDVTFMPANSGGCCG